MSLASVHVPLEIRCRLLKRRATLFNKVELDNEFTQNVTNVMRVSLGIN